MVGPVCGGILICCEAGPSIGMSNTNKASFMEGFMALNITNFADMTRIENDEVSWDARRVLSP